MGLVIDTNVFIDAENGRVNLNDLDFSDYGDAFIMAVTVSELLSCVHLARTADRRIQRSAFAEGIIANIPVLAFNEEAPMTRHSSRHRPAVHPPDAGSRRV
jgi:predicted nucleic acid-binding protein